MTGYEHEAIIRLGAFFGVLLLMMGWEWRAPRRTDAERAQRWPGNLGIIVCNTLLVRAVIPVLPVGLALLCAGQGWGLLNQWPVNAWLSMPLTLVLFDFAIYWQHRVFHALPMLWRLHRVHHADTAFDVTTGIRFHPVEILLSLLFKLVLVVVTGAPAIAVLLFEVVLNASSMFNHGNVRLPLRFDTWLRRVFVTPDMHRVHHSVIHRETDSNFGFNLSWWDRLFGTYRAHPACGHEAMQIGIDEFREADERGLWHLLTQPFRRPGAVAERQAPAD